MTLDFANRGSIISCIYVACQDASGALPAEFALAIAGLMGEISVNGAIEVERCSPFHEFLKAKIPVDWQTWDFIHFREPRLPAYIGKSYEIETTTMYVRPTGSHMLEFHWGGQLVERIVEALPDGREVEHVKMLFSDPNPWSNVFYMGTPKSCDNELQKLWHRGRVVSMQAEEMRERLKPVGVVGLDSDNPVVVGRNKDGLFEPIEGGIMKADVAAAISIPFDKLPEADFIRGPRYVLGEKKAADGKLEFYAYEKSALDEADDLRELNAKLLSDDDIKQYEGSGGGRYVFPEHRPCGYTSIDVLQDLWGMPYNNLILAYILGLHPTKIHVGNWINCDCCTDRVHVSLSDDGKTVRKISQEVRVGYGTGYDIGVAKRCLKEGKPLPEKGSSGVIGHTAGLERVDFT